MFKLQVQESDEDLSLWHDVKDSNGEVLTFEHESDARAKLEALFPILVQMERYAGPKRTRVINIIVDDVDWPVKK